MTPIKDLFDKFNTLIVEHGSSVVQGKFITLLQAQLSALKEEVEKVQKENTKLAEENAALKKQVEAAVIRDEFEEAQGALFKRKRDGSYHSVPYCPVCKTALGKLIGDLPFNCRCGFTTAFAARDVSTVMADLPA